MVICCQQKSDLEFIDTTTCHGPKRFANPEWNPWRRLLWFLLFLASLCLLIQQLCDRFEQFLKFEMKTDVSITVRRELDFPTITLCNANMFSKAFLQPMDYDLLENVTNAFYEEFDLVRQTDDSANRILIWQLAKKYETIEKEIVAKYTDTNGQNMVFNVPQWISRKGWRLKYKNSNRTYNAMLTCKLAETDCDQVMKFDKFLTQHGLCYVLTPNQNARIIQKAPGFESGLKLTIDVDEENYSNFTMANAWAVRAGLKIFVQDKLCKDEKSFCNSDAIGVWSPDLEISASSGLSTSIGLEVSKRQFVNQPPWGTCQDIIEDKPQLYYSQRTCFAECFTEAIRSLCNCSLWYFEMDGGYMPCGLAMTNACTLMKTIVGTNNLTANCVEKCSIACFEVDYTFTTSSMKLVSDHTLPNWIGQLQGINFDPKVEVTKRFIEDNIVQLEIGYLELSVETTTSTPSQSLSAFISDIGGQLGLFAGISVITIGEILEYPIMKCMEYFRNKKNKTGAAK